MPTCVGSCFKRVEHATSPIFEEVREEGRAEELRTLLLRLGRQKFSKAPTKKQCKALEAIADLVQLETLAGRLLAVDSWKELGEG